MSLYSVLKICHLLDHDPEFRARMQQELAGTIADFRLTDEERAAILQGDVRKLHDMGGHGYLLSRLPRYGIAGLNAEIYTQRMKGGAASNPR